MDQTYTKTHNVAVADVLDVLLESVDLLEAFGWTQFVMSRAAGEHCAAGAIKHACRSVYANRTHTYDVRSLELAAAAVLANAIADQDFDGPVRLNFGIQAVINFNDDAVTTYEDVRLAFKKAICALEDLERT